MTETPGEHRAVTNYDPSVLRAFKMLPAAVVAGGAVVVANADVLPMWLVIAAAIIVAMFGVYVTPNGTVRG